jgi:hypothetical protein
MQTSWALAFSWLDVKLGMRMMRKHPGASLAIVFALAIGIPASLLPNHLIGKALGQSPPFDEGERVVGSSAPARTAEPSFALPTTRSCRRA